MIFDFEHFDRAIFIAAGLLVSRVIFNCVVSFSHVNIVISIMLDVNNNYKSDERSRFALLCLG